MALSSKFTGKLAIGQRVYVNGRMKSDGITIHDSERQENVRRQEVEIMVNELYFLDSNPKTNERDLEDNKISSLPQMNENSVEMFASIGTDVHSERNLTAFSIINHFTKK